MGDARRRSESGETGPWRPHLPPTAGPRGSEARETARLAMLTKAAETHTAEALHAARERGGSEGLAFLAGVIANAGAMLEAEVASAYTETPRRVQLHKSIACQRGCTSCCYIPVAVTVVEAIGAAVAAARDPTLLAQIALLSPAIAAAGDFGRWRQRLPCTLLRDGACAVYTDRPLPCRAYVSLDAGRCERALASGSTAAQFSIPVLDLPRQLAAAIRSGIRAACIAQGLQDAHVELTAAVAQLVADPTAGPRWLAGEKVFTPKAPPNPAVLESVN